MGCGASCGDRARRARVSRSAARTRILYYGIGEETMTFTVSKGIDTIRYTTLEGFPMDRKQPIRFKQGRSNTGIIFATPKRLIQRFDVGHWK